jgi:hypothetical protein
MESLRSTADLVSLTRTAKELSIVCRSVVPFCMFDAAGEVEHWPS